MNQNDLVSNRGHTRYILQMLNNVCISIHLQVRTKVPNFLSVAGIHLINCIKSISLGKHLHPFIDFTIDFVSSTETTSY